MIKQVKGRITRTIWYNGSNYFWEEKGEAHYWWHLMKPDEEERFFDELAITKNEEG